MLAALLRGDSYGYRIVRDLSAAIEVSESALYPILKRLEAEGSVRSYGAEHNGRLRRYYRVNPAGRDRVREFLDGWNQLEAAREFVSKCYRDGSEGGAV